jgi:hypothetical protein
MDDQLQSLLVQALGPGAPAVLGQDVDADPTALLTQYLLQRRTADDDEGGDEGDPPSAAERAELEDLRRRNEIFAAAVGACEICWGDDPTCQICRGEGRPGWEEPNRGLFAEVAGPALRRLRREATGVL